MFLTQNHYLMLSLTSDLNCRPSLSSLSSMLFVLALVLDADVFGNDTISVPVFNRIIITPISPQGLCAFHNIGVSRSRWMGVIIGTVSPFDHLRLCLTEQNCFTLEMLFSKPFLLLKHTLGLTKSIQVTETLLTCHVPMSGFVIVSKATSVEVFTQDENFLVSVKRLRHFMLKTPCDLKGLCRLSVQYPGEMRIKSTSTISLLVDGELLDMGESLQLSVYDRIAHRLVDSV